MLALGLASPAERMAADLALGDDREEILAAAPEPMLAAAVAPPTVDLLPPAPARPMWPWFAGGGTLAAAATLLLVVGVTRDDAPMKAPTVIPAKAVAPAEAPAMAVVPEVAAPKPAAEPAPSPTAAAPEGEKPAAAPAPARPAPPAAAARPRPKPKARRRGRRGGDEVDDLLGALDGAGGGGRKPARGRRPAAATPAGGSDPSAMLPERLSRSQILTVVRKNAAQVRKCAGEGVSGIVKVRLSIQSTGRVSSPKVVNQAFKGTSVGNCVEAKVRSFRFPQFSGSAMSITLPFSL
jgi:hypothetical protein